MEYEPRNEWPMGSYKHSWKLFRRMSNENEVTAEHLLSRPSWPRVAGVVLVDVGCGDGLVTQQIVHLSDCSVAEVRLLDPDATFLQEAKQHIQETGIVTDVKTFLGPAELNLPEHYQGANVVLAVHVVYLMQDGAFESMLSTLPRRVPMYVVLDTPDSVFAKLWKETAPKYWQRSSNAHAILDRLSRGEYAVNYSTISSRLDSPLDHSQPAIRNSILSILCYADYDGMAEEQQGWVIRIS
jgi:hypothetical protein